MDRRIQLIRGDITKLNVDAIVNAANTSLSGGGGVNGAIHEVGGARIVEECKALGGCKTGDAVLTSGGNLPARYVIHAVGPIWSGGQAGEDQLLSSAYESSLKRAVEKNLGSIAFPNISTGIYGYPKLEAARIALYSVGTFLEKNETLEEVIFCCFEEGNYELYKQLMT